MIVIYADQITCVSDDVTFYRATACNATHGIAVTILFVHPSVCQMHVQGRGSHGAKAAVAHTKFRPMAPR